MIYNNQMVMLYQRLLVDYLVNNLNRMLMHLHILFSHRLRYHILQYDIYIINMKEKRTNLIIYLHVYDQKHGILV